MTRNMTVLGMLFTMLTVPATAQTSQTHRYSQRELLQNFAVSRCLGRVYGNDAVRDDAFASAAGYLEFGRQGIEAYGALDKLAERYASLTYHSHSGAPLHTMKCIDLFRSKDLNRLVNRLLRPHDRPATPPGN